MPVFESQYAPYIWAVYILSFLMIGTMILVTAIRARKAKRAHDKIIATRDTPQ